jgi:hypothetical protein
MSSIETARLEPQDIHDHRRDTGCRRDVSLMIWFARARHAGAPLFADALFHRLALGEFVDEFVEIVDLSYHWLLDLLHADAAYDAGDQGS